MPSNHTRLLERPKVNCSTPQQQADSDSEDENNEAGASWYTLAAHPFNVLDLIDCHELDNLSDDYSFEDNEGIEIDTDNDSMTSSMENFGRVLSSPEHDEVDPSSDETSDEEVDAAPADIEDNNDFYYESVQLRSNFAVGHATVMRRRTGRWAVTPPSVGRPCQRPGARKPYQPYDADA